MWVYEKKLQYPVKIKNPNPRLAGIIIDALGPLKSFLSLSSADGRPVDL